MLRNDEECCQILLRYSSPLLVNHTDRLNQCTALHAACERGAVDIVDLLLQHGADVNVQNAKGITALLFASDQGHVDVCQRLLRAPNVNLELGLHSVHSTALWMAALKDQYDICKLLLDAGAVVDSLGEHGTTPLFVACQGGHVNVAKLFIERGADVNLLRQDGMSMLFIASQGGHLECCRLLVSAGARLQATFHGASSLHVAAECGHLSVCQFLMDAGIDVNVRHETMNFTPLFMAAQQRQTECGLLLLERGANPNIPNQDMVMPLHLAAEQGNLEFCKALLARGANVNCVLRNGLSPLWSASGQGHVEGRNDACLVIGTQNICPIYSAFLFVTHYF